MEVCAASALRSCFHATGAAPPPQMRGSVGGGGTGGGAAASSTAVSSRSIAVFLSGAEEGVTLAASDGPAQGRGGTAAVPLLSS
jgi:hypothetical protein